MPSRQQWSDDDLDRLLRALPDVPVPSLPALNLPPQDTPFNRDFYWGLGGAAGAGLLALTAAIAVEQGALGIVASWMASWLATDQPLVTGLMIGLLSATAGLAVVLVGDSQAPGRHA